MPKDTETATNELYAMSRIFPNSSPSYQSPQWAVSRANFSNMKLAVPANADIAALVDMEHADHFGKTRLPLLPLYAGLAIATWIPVVLGAYAVSLLFD
jgi:hypothetical protein